MTNPRNKAVLSIFQEEFEEFENYLILYQNKKLFVKGSNTLNFEEGYEKEVDCNIFPTLLSFISFNAEGFNVGLDKSSIYKTSTSQKLLGCTILIPECEVLYYFESGVERYNFGEPLSNMLRYMLSLASNDIENDFRDI